MVDAKISQSDASLHDAENGIPLIPYQVRSLLDVGCGTGYVLEEIRQTCPYILKLVGVDANPELIAVGKRRYPFLTLFVERGEDMFMMARYYDMVMARFSLEHMDVESVIPRMVAGLRPYGRVWLATVTWRSVLRRLQWALSARQFSRAVFALYVLLNGIVFHCTGRTFRYRERFEVFLTRRRLRKILESCGCVDVRYSDHGLYAIITAEGK